MDEPILLNRLLKKQDDGVYKVVGWEWHKLVKAFETPMGIVPDNYTTLHAKLPVYKSPPHYKKYGTLEEAKFSNITVKYNCSDKEAWIDHDRKDRYTGVEIDGKKLFERDKVEYYVYYRGARELRNGIIQYKAPTYYIDTEIIGDPLSFYSLQEGFKIIGIEGVE